MAGGAAGGLVFGAGYEASEVIDVSDGVEETGGLGGEAKER